MILGSEDAYNLARQKVGKKLWMMCKNKKFNLSDPYCHETRFAYEPLHDEHLLDFFTKPVNLKHLLKAGLITDKLDVKCSLRDYNEYRRYLRKIYADRVNKELRRRNCLFVEIKALCFAKNQAHQEVKMCEIITKENIFWLKIRKYLFNTILVLILLSFLYFCAQLLQRSFSLILD